MKIDTDKIITKYYKPDSKAYNILVAHSRLVAEKSIQIAKMVPHLKPDISFIEEAAMLHDIGIFKTKAPDLGCTGDDPYLFHGFRGREVLDSLDLPEHGLVAERHTGAGLTKKDIADNNLGLPLRDMMPITIEQIIICYADKFFSKNPDSFEKEKSFEEAVALLERYGKEQAEKFIVWAELLMQR